MLALGLAAGLFAGLAACSAGPDGATAAAAPAGQADDVVATGDEDSGVSAPGYPAFRPSPPQIDSRSNRVLTKPKVVVISFEADPMRATIQDFVSKVGASAYWSTTTKEYGVGPLTALPPIVIAEPAPAIIDDEDIKAMLKDRLDGSHPEYPVADAQTIYAIAYPEGTSVTNSGYSSCSNAFGAYHGEVRLAPLHSVPYIVLPRCSSYLGLEGADEVSVVLSHELVEASVDPFVASAASYNVMDDEHAAWSLFFGGAEPGDLCTQYSTVPADVGFRVQRTWSNAEALAGRQPCVPSDGLAYFGAVPVVSETYDADGTVIPAVKVPVGASRTIDVQVFSDKPTGELSIEAVDNAVLEGRPAELSFKFDRKNARNGDVLRLTITALRAANVGSLKGLGAFAVRAKTATGIEYRPAYIAN